MNKEEAIEKLNSVISEIESDDFKVQFSFEGVKLVVVDDPKEKESNKK